MDVNPEARTVNDEFYPVGKAVSHKDTVRERGVHAASTAERECGLDDSNASPIRTLKQAEACAPNGTDNSGMGGSDS